MTPAEFIDGLVGKLLGLKAYVVEHGTPLSVTKTAVQKMFVDAANISPTG